MRVGFIYQKKFNFHPANTLSIQLNLIKQFLMYLN